MRSREEWEQWYERADPWDYEGSDEDVLRISAILSRLGRKHFTHALDLGCGEGKLTNALSAVADNVVGYDISENALVRARKRFPGTEFRQGDLLNVIRRPEVTSVPFDLIVVAEVLYYLQTDDERREALAGLARLGQASCVYYFSVIVTGSSSGRRYFTHDEFMRLLSDRFKVGEYFPVAVNLPRVVERLIRAVPFRGLRLSWQQKLIESLDSSRWEHVAYLAERIAPAQSHT